MGKTTGFETRLSSAFLPVALALLRIGALSDVQPSPSAPVSREAREMRDTFERVRSDRVRNPIRLVGMMIASRQLALVDHLRGISTLVVHGSHQHLDVKLSPASLARAALEALAHIYWMTEPGIGAAERVRRLACDAAHDIRSRHRVVPAAREAGVEPVLEVEKIEEMCREYDIDCYLGKENEETGIRLPHVRGDDRPAAFDLMAEMMPAVSAPQMGSIFYNLMSDAAHGSTQGLLGRALITEEDDGSLTIEMDRIREVKHAAPVLYAVAAPAQRLMDYYGQDDGPFAETYRAATDRLTALA